MFCSKQEGSVFNSCSCVLCGLVLELELKGHFRLHDGLHGVFLLHQYLQQVSALISTAESCVAYCDEGGAGVRAATTGAAAGTATAFGAALEALAGASAAGGPTAGAEETNRNFVYPHFPMKDLPLHRHFPWEIFTVHFELLCCVSAISAACGSCPYFAQLQRNIVHDLKILHLKIVLPSTIYLGSGNICSSHKMILSPFHHISHFSMHFKIKFRLLFSLGH